MDSISVDPPPQTLNTISNPESSFSIVNGKTHRPINKPVNSIPDVTNIKWPGSTSSDVEAPVGNGESLKPLSTITDTIPTTDDNDEVCQQDLNEPIKGGNPFADTDGLSTDDTLSRTPPVQMTTNGYFYDVPDPNRIPSSVFDIQSNVVTSKEWSLASNESLFSLHAANSSCSPPPTSDDEALIDDPYEIITIAADVHVANGGMEIEKETIHETSNRSSCDEALIDDPYEIITIVPDVNVANEGMVIEKGTIHETSNRSSCDDNVVNIGGGTETSSPAINSPTISRHSGSSVHSFAFPM